MADTLPVDPTDRDLMIRTIIGEAGGSDLNGMAGVANVIANRLASGQYGKTGSDVVLAPNQFEPWSSRGAELLGYDPNSDAYKAAGSVLDGVLSGKVKDNTNGATHFYAPVAQSALGRNAPAWGTGQPLASAGGHLFFAPQGPVNRTSAYPAAQAIAAVTQPNAKTKAPAVPAKQSFDALKAFGVDPDAAPSPSAPVQAASPAPAPTPAAASAKPAAAPPVASYDALKAFGVDAGDAPAAAPATAAAPSAPDLGAGTAFGSGVINGIPIVGPALQRGEDYVGSHIGSWISGKPVDQVLAEGQARRAATEAAHPYSTVGGNLTGATLGLSPIAATEAGATALGLRGGTLLSRMGAGAVSGGALGAGDAYLRGQDPVSGAGFGAIGGGAGPLAGTAIGGVINRLTDVAQAAVPTGVPGVSRSAANIANQLIDWSGGHDAVAARAAGLGALGTLADADPTLTAIAGGLASKPGEAQGIIRNALTARAADAGDRIGDTVTNVVGPDRSNASLNAYYKGQRAAINSAYPAVHAAAPPVGASHVVNVIDSQLATATGPQKAVLQRFRNELVTAPAVTDETGTEIQPEQYQDNSQILHNLRMDLDSTIKYGNPTLGVQPGTLSRTQGAVGAMRGALDDALKTQVPGMADLDAASALAARNVDAVQQGYNSVLGANVPHPSDFAATLNDNDPETNIALTAGMGSRIHRAFGTGTQRDAVTLNKLLAGGEDGYSAQNLGAAFGQPAANNLVDTLAREQTFNNTTNSVLNNSETARRQAANKLLDDTQPGSMSVLGATTAGMIAQPVKSLLVDPLVRTIMENPTAPRNVELARMLIAQGDARGQFIAQLQRLAGRNALVDSIGRPAAAAANAAVNRLALGAGLVRQ